MSNQVFVNEGWQTPRLDGSVGGLARFVELTVPLVTVSESNTRGHWAKRARRAKTQRHTMAMVVRAAQPPGPPCVVTLTRIAPSSGLDSDNLPAACKHVRDGVADALGIDDRDARVEWRYSQERGKAYAVRVRVER